MKQLSSSGSIGRDGVSAKMLKLSSYGLHRVLANLFNYSLWLSAFLSLWKVGYVTPVFKSSCKFEMNNYWPIFIFPVISRLFERILSAQLRAHLEDNNLLSPMQHGFRPFRSCQIDLLSLKSPVCKPGLWVLLCYRDARLQ